MRELAKKERPSFNGEIINLQFKKRKKEKKTRVDEDITDGNFNFGCLCYSGDCGLYEHLRMLNSRYLK